jgi:integrase
VPFEPEKNKCGLDWTAVDVVTYVVTIFPMASLRKLPNSPYWIACFRDAAGRRTNRSTKQTDVRKARPIAKEWEDAARKGRAGEITQAAAIKVLGEIVEISTGNTFQVSSVSDHFRGYLQSRETLGKTASTVRRYKPILDGFLAFIGAKRAAASVGSVTAQEIEHFRDAELRAGKGGTTADFAVKVLRAVFEAARRKGLCLANPAQAVELTAATAEEREVFSDVELRDLLNTAGDTDWRGMILVGIHCGLRIHDAASLTWESIDLASATLSHRAEKTRGRSRRETVIYMHPQLANYLESRAGDDPRAPLFPSLAGRKTGSAGGLSNAFSRLMENAGIRPALGDEKKGKGRRFRSKGFHAMRHSMITRLATANVSADVRRAMVGQSSDAVHRKYVHLDTTAQKAAVENLPAI